ncbi:MAG: efflux transporter periplasmic adaptor subunit [Ponticaulis sp.]|nr:efflux transporter periplasmic adaptor subunit [Ponticaulis sp.]
MKLPFLFPYLLALILLSACQPSQPTNMDDHHHEDDQDEDGHHDEHEEHEDNHDEGEHSDHVELSPDQAREAGIVLGEASEAPLLETLSLPAELRFDADRIAEVSPQVSGRIIRLYAGEGDIVSRGSALALLSSHEIADLKAQFLTAMAAENLAEEALKREETLFADRITSETDLLAAQAAFTKAEAERDAVENQLHAFGITHSDLDKLSSAPDGTLANIVLHAPIAGTIIRRNATLGAAVSAEDASAPTLFTILDDSVLWADIAVYKQDTEFVSKGALVVLRSESGKVLAEGQIESVLPVIDETSRTGTARMIIPNPDGEMRPGQFATAEISTGSSSQVLQLPSGAIVAFEGRDVVFMPTDDGFEPHPVVTGRSTGETTAILSGLETGESVVVEGAFTLKAQLEKDAFGDGHNH